MHFSDYILAFFAIIMPVPYTAAHGSRPSPYLIKELVEQDQVNPKASSNTGRRGSLLDRRRRGIVSRHTDDEQNVASDGTPLNHDGLPSNEIKGPGF
ncbi:uncharacterized protein EV154DRAFT_494888 [Mucor mucedo]|uniref:uncharacterized protein n=1 Tax=Mucor mucedo TaxID=29922 RepID=UPI002220D265|nr:uncharacterized protein EV154DRAFT_494888 [Mucor mucedo]KAI7895779.1 hypothetical protein EV154DRAFT_494888 [Mucor mucedo]